MQNYPFLHPTRIMDAKRRRPDHPDYDPRTLYLPPNFFKVQLVRAAAVLLWRAPHAAASQGGISGLSALCEQSLCIT